MMLLEKLISGPYFQVTLAAVVGIGVVALGLAVAVYKFFLPRLGKALLAPAPPEATGETRAIPPMLINPEYCTACKAEHERSIQNQENIGRLFNKFDDLKDRFDEGFGKISQEIGDTKTEIIKALAVKS
ncbi:MAG: hypothetical protein PHU44_13630 [Syntrophales bacterium]|nr:hypothetical protein [Syntrophales bacterium]MDD5640157.1 hypothetical protein [Syntrophales bacterium]